MANLQPSFAIPPSFAGASIVFPSSSLDWTGGSGDAAVDPEINSIERLVCELNYPKLRENALRELSKRREVFYSDLGMLMWNNALSPLLQEIVSVYPALSPPTLSPAASEGACNALTLLECVASNRYTREFFLNARIVLYLYPLLNANNNTIPFENLRYSSLAVIEALIKANDTKVISFFMQTEIIPLLLRTMETGSELSKTMATFVLDKILLDDVRLHYICATAERFFTVHSVLANMLVLLSKQPFRISRVVKISRIPRKWLRPIIRCYLRLSGDPRACAALQNCLPDMLKDKTFGIYLRDDPESVRLLQQLLNNVTPAGEAPPSVRDQFP